MLNIKHIGDLVKSPFANLLIILTADITRIIVLLYYFALNKFNVNY